MTREVSISGSASQRRAPGWWVIVSILLPLFFCAPAPAQKTAAPKSKPVSNAVLVLVSRGPQDAWAVAEVDGILQAFQAARPGIAPSVEYMDWQGTGGSDYEQKLTDYYATKYFLKRESK